MPSLDAFAREKLAGLDARGLARTLTPTARRGGARVERGGRTLISFACNDYLGLAHHPRVLAAAHAALDRRGAGAGGSRLVVGDAPETQALEAALARWKGAEAALVFASGYLANVGVVPALAGPGDLVLLDALAHACLWAGARLSGARVEAFAHNDMGDLAAKLAELAPGTRHVLVVTERVFSMDGDLAPMGALLALADLHGAWTLADDAHGIAPPDPDAPKADVEMGTLLQGVRRHGRLRLRLPRGRGPPHQPRAQLRPTPRPGAAAAAAAHAALEVMQAEPERAARTLTLARRLAERLGVPAVGSAIVPLVIGEADAAMWLSAALEAEGFLVVAIRPPTVPARTARLRFALSAAHTEADVDAVADAVARARIA